MLSKYELNISVAIKHGPTFCLRVLEPLLARCFVRKINSICTHFRLATGIFVQNNGAAILKANTEYSVSTHVGVENAEERRCHKGEHTSFGQVPTPRGAMDSETSLRHNIVYRDDVYEAGETRVLCDSKCTTARSLAACLNYQVFAEQLHSTTNNNCATRHLHMLRCACCTSKTVISWR